jgi:hypothetical protein
VSALLNADIEFEQALILKRSRLAALVGGLGVNIVVLGKT